jgi:ectoine hydroxylase
MKVESLALEFWQQGYLCIDNFFDDSLMDKYHKLILQHFADNPDFVHNDEFLEKSKTDVVPWFPQRDGIYEFDIAEKNKHLIALTNAILGHDWSSLYSMVMFSHEGSNGQAWHQDCSPENKAQFNLNRLVYTMDIDSTIGGEVLVVPGTHKGGAITIGDSAEDFPEQIMLTPKKGSLVLIHGHLWHRVLPVFDHYRVSTNYRCCPANTPSTITDIGIYRNMVYDFSRNQVLADRRK